jgi:hypothetical protein
MVASDISGIGISILRKKIKPKNLEKPLIDSDFLEAESILSNFIENRYFWKTAFASGKRRLENFEQLIIKYWVFFVRRRLFFKINDYL